MTQNSLVRDVVGFVSISATFPSADPPVTASNGSIGRTALLSLERKPSVSSPFGVSPNGCTRSRFRKSGEVPYTSF